VPAIALVALLISGGWLVTQQSPSGWDMRSSWGESGMMDGSGYEEMMGDYGWSEEDATPVGDLDQARERAADYAEVLQPGLEVGEVMRFENHYYADLQEPDGSKVTEVLIDSRSGAVRPEMGPATMWNNQYTMMGRGGGSEADISAADAQQIADRWLADRDGGSAPTILLSSPATTRCTPCATAKSQGCCQYTHAAVTCGSTPGTVISWRCRSTREQLKPASRPRPPGPALDGGAGPGGGG